MTDYTDLLDENPFNEEELAAPLRDHQGIALSDAQYEGCITCGEMLPCGVICHNSWEAQILAFYDRHEPVLDAQDDEDVDAMLQAIMDHHHGFER